MVVTLKRLPGLLCALRLLFERFPPRLLPAQPHVEPTISESRLDKRNARVTMCMVLVAPCTWHSLLFCLLQALRLRCRCRQQDGAADECCCDGSACKQWRLSDPTAAIRGSNSLMLHSFRANTRHHVATSMHALLNGQTPMPHRRVGRCS